MQTKFTFIALILFIATVMFGLSIDNNFDLDGIYNINKYSMNSCNWRSQFIKDNKIFYNNQYGIHLFDLEEESFGNITTYSSEKHFSPYDYYNGIIAEYDVNQATKCFKVDFYTFDDENEINYVSTLELSPFVNFMGVQLYNDFYVVAGENNSSYIRSYESNQLLKHQQGLIPNNNLRYDDNHGVFYDCFTEHSYFCQVSSDSIEVIYDLGESSRDIKICGDKLISYSNYEIDFYDISDGYNYVNTMLLTHGINLEGCFFNGDLLGFVSRDFTIPSKIIFKLYDTSDLSNVSLISTKVLKEFPSEFYCNQTMVSSEQEQILSINNNIYIFGTGFYQVLNIEGNSVNISDVSSYGHLSDQCHKISPSILYCTRFENQTYTQVYDFTNDDNVTINQLSDISDRLSCFSDNNEYIAGKNFSDCCINLYHQSNNDLEYLDSFSLGDQSTEITSVQIVKWDGTKLIYRSDELLYCYSYQNHEFQQEWTYSINSSNPWWVYGLTYLDYIYLFDMTDKDATVLQLEESSYNVLYEDSYNSELTHGRYGLSDGILTINDKAIDLQSDPVNLTHEIELDIVDLDSTVKKCGDYLLYCGRNNNSFSPEDYDIVHIYKLINDDYHEVGYIPIQWYCNSVDMFLSDNEDNFKVFVSTSECNLIYSCHITPNGDFEVQPVKLECSNYPNPFNPETTISYNIDKASDVELTIYNIKGQKVRTLVDDQQEAGRHDIVWDGTDGKGKKVASGTYLYKVKADDQEVVNKMLMIK